LKKKEASYIQKKFFFSIDDYEFIENLCFLSLKLPLLKRGEVKHQVFFNLKKKFKINISTFRKKFSKAGSFGSVLS
jgi:hypothetical protein